MYINILIPRLATTLLINNKKECACGVCWGQNSDPHNSGCHKPHQPMIMACQHAACPPKKGEWSECLALSELFGGFAMLPNGFLWKAGTDTYIQCSNCNHLP